MKPIGAIIRPRLTREYRQALEEIRAGADVVSPLLGRTLREIQLKHPELLTIKPAAARPVSAVRPYFHASLTKAGEIALEPAPRRKKGGAA